MYDEREDTDPGRGLAALGPVRVYLQTTSAFGRYRRLFVPLGVIALIGIGVHAAADRFDNWMFLFLDWLDRGAEHLYGIFVDAALSEPEERKLAFAEMVNLGHKERGSRWAALGVELLIDLRLGLGAMGAFDEDDLGYVVPGSGVFHRAWAVVGRRVHVLKGGMRRTGSYLRHLSVEKIYIPLAVAIAAVTGSLALFMAIDNAFYALGRRLPAEWEAWSWLSPWPALLCSVAVFWRLGIPAFVGALARSDRIMRRDLEAGEGLVRRTMRGVLGAALILPVLAAGIWAGTPLGAWMKQILGPGGP